MSEWAANCVGSRSQESCNIVVKNYEPDIGLYHTGITPLLYKFKLTIQGTMTWISLTILKLVMELIIIKNFNWKIILNRTCIVNKDIVANFAIVSLSVMTSSVRSTAQIWSHLVQNYLCTIRQQWIGFANTYTQNKTHTIEYGEHINCWDNAHAILN